MDPEDRYYNPGPQYTHSLINLGSHTPETPEGVDGYILIIIMIIIIIIIIIMIMIMIMIMIIIKKK